VFFFFFLINHWNSIWAVERISEYRYYEVYTSGYRRDGNSNGESGAQPVVK